MARRLLAVVRKLAVPIGPLHLAMFIIGLTAIVLGIGLINVPVAIILGGVALTAIAISEAF